MTTLAQHDSSQGARVCRILIVEDDDEAGGALAKVLKLKGFEVIVRGDGASALEFLRAGPAPDFILTDLLLPDLDGREVARQARLLAPKARIALITGWSLEEELNAAHIDAVFLKPFEIGAVIATFLAPDSAEGEADRLEPAE